MSTEITTSRPRPGQQQIISHAPQVPAPPSAASTNNVQQRTIPIPLELPKIAHMAKAVASVMANIGTINKGGYNSFHDYRYARMEDLLVKLTPLMGKNGIVVIQNEVERQMVEGNRIAVVYEFSILHESGEMWPERPRFTGMAMARDRKGNFDDKAINKAHTAARKYFLLSLFQVPTGDIDDADATDPPQTASRTEADRRVPGPGAAPEPQAAPQTRSAPSPAPSVGPRKIMLGAGGGVNEWTKAYLDGVATSKTRDEVLSWDALNDMALQRIHAEHPEISLQIMESVERHIDKITAPREPAPPVDTNFGMPDPAARPAEAIAWVTEKLSEFKHYIAAENFWNQVIAPREVKFTPDAWDELMRVWDHTEARLNANQTGDQT